MTIPMWALWAAGLVIGVPLLLAVLFFAWLGFVAMYALSSARFR
jgi:hypothetical protein